MGWTRLVAARTAMVRTDEAGHRAVVWVDRVVRVMHDVVIVGEFVAGRGDGDREGWG